MIIGTRPEIIKMSPVIRDCEKRGLEHFILHKGQHYSYNMDRVFFERLGLPEARYTLEAGAEAHGEQMEEADGDGEEEGMMEKSNRWRNPFRSGKALGRNIKVF